ncbi:MAG: bifunctional phosphoribosylaminoimidazolecarboxamide formyltransferase/IMP cyclohydrolase [Oscillospiraceae bacterium]|jgi:phosphoribosylaminoimidazolecarboxamide formyltransferase/IMP cyclohydrolase|nr:bifunctional phosphoribosylaminoimidazolecarboxamide formyltransferase/IMP cyclohydrolase [Oscillospiraceae bacterium]
MKKRAILSVFDKTAVVDFARGLLALDFELLSTGGTHRALTEAGLPCTEVSDVTGFPECLDGRVKTLHPAIHGGLLAMRSNPAHMERIAELGIEPINVVAVNLYPFAATIQKPGVSLEECIENIDIGGPTMLRAAAKNWQDVAVIVNPADYPTVLEELKAWGEVTRETKFELCGKVFAHTAHYDALINNYLRSQRWETDLPETLALPYERVQSMRYGENPHQAAAFYKEANALPNTLPTARQIHGKELSYNNINDANGAIDCLKEFGAAEPTAVAVKHANPCGVGVGGTILAAYLNAYNADPVSIFGGIVALNRAVDSETAAELAKTFLEIIIAPSFDADALEILTKKPNIRLLELPAIAEPNPKGAWDMKRVAGGLLVQELDTAGLDESKLVCVTERAPTAEEKAQLLFAWKVVKHTKSNAIVLAKGQRTTGVGPGQTNRITALELAIRYAGEDAAGSVLASDAFFPFDDCVQAAQKAGITAIIQPGGSIRDADSIAKCNKAGIAMLFTGIRHFKH